MFWPSVCTFCMVLLHSFSFPKLSFECEKALFIYYRTVGFCIIIFFLEGVLLFCSVKHFHSDHLPALMILMENILWTDDRKVEHFGSCVSHYIWRKINSAFHKQNVMPSVKLSADIIVGFCCFRIWLTSQIVHDQNLNYKMWINLDWFPLYTPQ